MSKYKQKEPDIIEICECLKELLNAELAIGNSINQYTATSNWPHPNSKFILLENDLTTDLSTLQYTNNIFYHICRDPHYGWHDECECRVHDDMLCAGDTRHFK